MNDGLDGRETIAFGLGAAEVATLVAALLAAYATLQSGLPAAVAWTCGGLLVVAGAALGWGRASGRSFLEWAVLLVRFTVRTRGATMLAGQSGAVVVPLTLRRHVAATGRAAPPPPRARPSPATGAATAPGMRIETFFSLNGGTGRTTLAVEVAALLAVRATAGRAAGGRHGPVALLDLAGRSPAVALRLGLALPREPGRERWERGADGPLVRHDTGLLVFPGTLAPLTTGRVSVAWAAQVLEAAERAGARLALVDVDNDLGAAGVEVLRRSHRVHVTLTACAGGVLDAYRSTAILHRLGVRQVDYVVNRCAGPAGMADVMGDLGGVVVAEIPLDAALIDAENRHVVASLHGHTASATAIGCLADLLEHPAHAGVLPAWGSRAG